MKKIRILSILYGSFISIYLLNKGLSLIEVILLLIPLSFIEWYDGIITERNKNKE